jgi:signal transduction histidine kinase
VVRAEQLRDAWTITIQDNGIGIEPTAVPRLFTVFARLHSSDQHPGHGVGLAVCRRIVERHGGHIRAESTPGEGTSVSFTLPSGTLPDPARSG